MNEPSPKQLEPWQQEDAARLYALFKKYATMSQMAFGSAYEIGNQSMVSQYILGKRPLNIEAAKKFSLGLGRPIDEFSPTLAKQIVEASKRIDQEPADDEHTPVRLIDAKASAGKGKIVFSEDVSKILMFRRDWLAHHGITDERDAACFGVDGRSMVDAGIPDKSIVIVNLRKVEPRSKKIFLVHTYDGLIVKQLMHEGGRWIARSRNEAEKDEFPDLPVGPEARVIGRAFWCAFEL